MAAAGAREAWGEDVVKCVADQLDIQVEMLRRQLNKSLEDGLGVYEVES